MDFAKSFAKVPTVASLGTFGNFCKIFAKSESPQAGPHPGATNGVVAGEQSGKPETDAEPRSVSASRRSRRARRRAPPLLPCISCGHLPDTFRLTNVPGRANVFQKNPPAATGGQGRAPRGLPGAGVGPSRLPGAYGRDRGAARANLVIRLFNLIRSIAITHL